MRLPQLTLFLSLFFWGDRGCTPGMWKFLGQGWNSCYRGDNARSLTTRPLGNSNVPSFWCCDLSVHFSLKPKAHSWSSLLKLLTLEIKWPSFMYLQKHCVWFSLPEISPLGTGSVTLEVAIPPTMGSGLWHQASGFGFKLGPEVEWGGKKQPYSGVLWTVVGKSRHQPGSSPLAEKPLLAF